MWSYNYTFTPEDETYLMHYGVKGMKWDLEKRRRRFAKDVHRQINSVRRNAKRAFKPVERKVKRSMAAKDARRQINSVRRNVRRTFDPAQLKRKVRRAQTAGKLLMRGYKAYNAIANRKKKPKKRAGPKKGYYSKALR